MIYGNEVCVLIEEDPCGYRDVWRVYREFRDAQKAMLERRSEGKNIEMYVVTLM